MHIHVLTHVLLCSEQEKKHLEKKFCIMLVWDTEVYLGLSIEELHFSGQSLLTEINTNFFFNVNSLL